MGFTRSHVWELLPSANWWAQPVNLALTCNQDDFALLVSIRTIVQLISLVLIKLIIVVQLIVACFHN